METQIHRSEHGVHSRDLTNHSRTLWGTVLVGALVTLAGCGQEGDQPSAAPLVSRATPRSRRAPTATLSPPAPTPLSSPSPGVTPAPSLTSNQIPKVTFGTVSSSTSTPITIPAPDTVASETATGHSTAIDVSLVQSLDTDYYLVTGTTTRDIFDSVKANGPDAGTLAKGHFTSGLTESAASYSYGFIDQGESCELQDVEVELGLVVTLPRHSDSASLSTVQLGRWQEFVEGVRVHEQTDVDIYIEGIEAFEQRVRGLPQEFTTCEDLEASLSTAWETEQALTGSNQEAFHQSEEQRSLELRGPVQQHIDDNKLAMADLDSPGGHSVGLLRYPTPEGPDR